MGYCFSDRYESGGAGLCGDAASYLLFADAIANDGVGKTGARILRRETIDLWRTPQLTGASKADFDALGRTGYGYALGVRVLTGSLHLPRPRGRVRLGQRRGGVGDAGSRPSSLRRAVYAPCAGLRPRLRGVPSRHARPDLRGNGAVSANSPCIFLPIPV